MEHIKISKNLLAALIMVMFLLIVSTVFGIYSIASINNIANNVVWSNGAVIRNLNWINNKILMSQDALFRLITDERYETDEAEEYIQGANDEITSALESIKAVTYGDIQLIIELSDSVSGLMPQYEQVLSLIREGNRLEAAAELTLSCRPDIQKCQAQITDLIALTEEQLDRSTFYLEEQCKRIILVLAIVGMLGIAVCLVFAIRISSKIARHVLSTHDKDDRYFR